VQLAVQHRTAFSRRVTEDLRGVVRGQFGPARGFTQRPAARAHGDPGETAHHDLVNGDDQRIARLGAFHKHRAGDRIWPGVAGDRNQAAALG